MARKLRVEYPGAVYHVMNRGDRREPIFMDDADRRRFVESLGEACAKTGWQVHAYVLMPNHFHLVVETPQPNLVAGMKWLLGTYTSRFNRRHKLFGHLFSGSAPPNCSTDLKPLRLAAGTSVLLDLAGDVDDVLDAMSGTHLAAARV
jgi:REP element-mobilizing transposase RayT